ncbi:hypothetical protein F4677DRAFT_450638 [Hypoxylon crocopeplum]|nr:hypothetical protein F4677DRAFT_450638 [Hypoxylon crocopeplum]
MPSAQEKFFSIIELHELALLNVSNSDLLVNVQRVSKQWKALMDRSPKIQQVLFLQASTKSPSDTKRVKNILVAATLDAFFGVSGKKLIDAPRTMIAPHLLIEKLQDKLPRWGAENASWRKMQVAQPPITKFSWQIMRQDNVGFRIKRPGTIAEFNFPGGLCAGDFYDFVLGIDGLQGVHWPSPKEVIHTSDLHLNPKGVLRLLVDIISAANASGSIVILQIVRRRSEMPKGYADIVSFEPLRRKSWQHTDLQKYHANLQRLETLVMTPGEDQPWKYETRMVDSATAMATFIPEACDPFRS